jgi:hypothetical protein
MLRNSLFALVVMLTAGWCVEPQPVLGQFPPPRGPVRIQGMPGVLEGRWFYQGDPWAPCFIRVGPRGRLRLTNEWGETVDGYINWGGQIVAVGWGGLVGDVRRGVIRWQNGTFWTR